MSIERDTRVGTLHLQATIDYALALSDDMLEVLADPPGAPAADVRAELQRMKAEGFEFVPCGCAESHRAPGRCPGRNR